jgi:SH3 domain-containing YSC84-like protein 1
MSHERDYFSFWRSELPHFCGPDGHPFGRLRGGQLTQNRLQFMKTKIIVLGLWLIGFAASSWADPKTDLDGRIFNLTAKFDQLQQQPDKRIPADILSRARGIILLDRTRAGFLFAYQGGSGVALAKDPATGRWSPAAFLTATEASLGPQIGAEHNFFVVLLMSSNSVHFLTDPNFEFGGEASGTAGNVSGGAAGTISDTERPVLVYSSRKGLYGGAAIKGGAVAPDENANEIYYGQWLSMRDILIDRKVQPTPLAANLAARIEAYAATAKASSSITANGAP